MPVLKLQLLFALKSGATVDQLEAPLLESLRRLRSMVPDCIAMSAAVALMDDPTPRTVLGQRVTGSAENRFDGMLEIHSESTTLTALAEFLGDTVHRMGEVCDLSKSAAVAGEVHLIVPGDDRLLLLYSLRRRPEFTHESFIEYWINVHAEHGRNAPELHGYRQLHGDMDETASACTRLRLGINDLDGVAESANSDVVDFIEVMSTSVTAGTGTDDTSMFIDQTRSAVFLTSMLAPLPEGD